jgi:cellulose synthase/poly-beta-1,6-N-acetylglucosamine synthase-like glycosyltransferase
MSTKPLHVSVILPCRNEAKTIRACLESVVASDFPKDELELLVVDGCSDDGTRQVIIEFSKQYVWINLLDNARRITPVAMNIGIRSAKGRILIRMDAHSVYPASYISALLMWLDRSNADNVGGICMVRPANKTSKAQAIAFALSHPWGVGNSHFRIGADKPRWVDTVPFGCYRREIFDRIGLYNEAFIRNQDDELNHRLIKNGGRILLVPEIVSFYIARESLGNVWTMFYQYGYFKPLAVRTIGAVTTARQLVPSAFVMSLALTASLAPWSHTMEVLLYALVFAYVTIDLSISCCAALRRSLRCGLWSVIVFPIHHMSYGIGYLKGILDFVVLQKRKTANPVALPLSR